MAEEIIEFNGAGFIPGVPGEFANCQVVFDEDTKEVLRVEPLGTVAVSLSGLDTSGNPVSEIVNVGTEETTSANSYSVLTVPEPTENQGG